MNKIAFMFMLLFAICVNESFSQEYILTSSIPSKGASNVAVTSTIKFTFDAALDTNDLLEFVEDPDDLKGAFLPIPYDKLLITAYRFTDDNKSIELDVTHTANTQFYWFIAVVLFEDGSTLSKNYVVNYFTSGNGSPNIVSGNVDVENSFVPGKWNFSESVTMSDDKPSLLKKIPAISAEQVSKSQNSIVEFEKSKILILLADENLETLDDYDLDVDYLRAAGETDGDGNYSVEQVPSGNYYVFGILLDEDAFAYGYYDGNNDNSPDLISVENQSVDNVDFNLFGFEGSLDEFIDSDYMKETVMTMAKSVFPDAQLVDIAGFEDLSDDTEDDEIAEIKQMQGLSSFWNYSFYSPENEAGFSMLASNSFVIPSTLDLDVFEEDLSDIIPLPANVVNSREIAANALELGGEEFLQDIPGDAMIIIMYRVTTITSRLEDVEIEDNLPHWEIYMGASYQIGDDYFFDENYIYINAITGTTVSVNDWENEIPQGVILSQNYPNPFNPSTSIRFELPQSTTMRLTIYDSVGRIVGVLADGMFSAGSHQIQWDATNLTSGVYFYRLDVNGASEIRKMMLIK